MGDNVHHQNAAQITKALVRKGIQLNGIVSSTSRVVLQIKNIFKFYADEAHSINYSKMNNRHIYRTITKEFIKYFNLSDSEKKTWYL